MANRLPVRQWTVRLEYQFDRLLAEKLAQAYEVLVPDRIRPTLRSDTGLSADNQELLNHETGGVVRACVL